MPNTKYYSDMCKKKWEETELKITLYELHSTTEQPKSKITSFFSKLKEDKSGYYLIETTYDVEVGKQYVVLKDGVLSQVPSADYIKKGIENWQKTPIKDLTIDDMQDETIDGMQIDHDLAQAAITNAKVMTFVYLSESDRYKELIKAGVKHPVAEVITFMDKFTMEPFYWYPPETFIAININKYNAVELRGCKLVNDLKEEVQKLCDEEDHTLGSNTTNTGVTSFFN